MLITREIAKTGKNLDQVEASRITVGLLLYPRCVGKKERDALKRLIKGIPGMYVQNQKAQVFEDKRTRRNRSRPNKKRNAIEDGLDNN
jgi:hypothetical protein